jgi:mannosyltransferase
MPDSSSKLPHIRFDRSTALVVLALFALALALRLIGLGREGLWIDEIFSASYTNLSFFETLVACMRFDVHPPLYYLQLDAWSALGHGDTWLMLNSIAWSMATLVLVYVAAAKRYGVLAGKLALAFCAVMGSEVYFANELRMYTLFGFLMTLSWVLGNRLLADYRLRVATPLIIVLAAVGALHSFGAVAVSAAMLYVFPWGERQQIRQRLPTWLGISVLVGVLILPWIVNSLLRHVGHLEPLSLADVAYTISGWLLGYRAIVQPEWLQISVTLLIVLALLLAYRVEPGLRRTILCYLLWPLAVAAAICLLGKPVWIFRSFAFCAPLLSICLGVLFGRLMSTSRGGIPQLIRGASLVLLAAWICVASVLAYRIATTPWKTQYREAAQYLQENARAGDIVYIPDHVTYWGVARYLVGPRWGSLLEVEDPINPDRSQFWPGIYRRLGPNILQHLHLIPRTRRTDGFRAPLYVGWTPLPEAKHAGVIWVVGLVHPPFIVFQLREVEVCPYHDLRTRDFTELRVFRLQCDRDGSSTYLHPGSS